MNRTCEYALEYEQKMLTVRLFSPKPAVSPRPATVAAVGPLAGETPVSKRRGRDRARSGAAVAAITPVVSPAVPVARGPSAPWWPSEVCLGCGHATNPPHRRWQCPHRLLPGWCAKGGCNPPLVIPAGAAVAAIAPAIEDAVPVSGMPPGLVADAPGLCGVSQEVLHTSAAIPVTFGLDSYCGHPVVSPVLATRLGNLGAVITPLAKPYAIRVAGGQTLSCNKLVLIWCSLAAPGVATVRFSLQCLIATIPSHAAVLISWHAILQYGLQPFMPGNLFPVAPVVLEGTSVPMLPDPPAPEEVAEDFHGVTYPLAAPPSLCFPPCPMIDVRADLGGDSPDQKAIAGEAGEDDAVTSACPAAYNDRWMSHPQEVAATVPAVSAQQSPMGRLKTLLGLPVVGVVPRSNPVASAVMEPAIREAFPCLQFVEPKAQVEGARLLLRYPEVFSTKFPSKGSVLKPMRIELVDEALVPRSAPPRRQSPVIQEFVSSTVKQLLELGFIRRSSSHVVSPVVVARAPNRDWRMCIDYTLVNLCTKRLHFPLPNMREILSRMMGFHCYAKLDFKKGFHQNSLEPGSCYLTAFSCPDGIYEWTVIPFGVVNGPAYFQQQVCTDVLAGLVGHICYVYIDDIIVGGSTWKQLLEHVDTILIRLKKSRLIVNAAKCQLGVPKIEYLGHVLSAAGITVPDDRRQGFRQLVPPTDMVMLRSFLGLMNYFRDFIPHFASISSPLYLLTKKGITFVWYEEHQRAFVALRDAVINAPLLYHIDYSLPLVLRTDASSYAVGGMLVQLHSGGERLISCQSKALSAAATRWSTRDQEAYGIFYCITVLSCYLLGHPFVVETDHRNLAFIMKATEGRVYRWKISLQQYDFSVVHIPGESNVVPDGLSRCVEPSEDRSASVVEATELFCPLAAMSATPSLSSIEPEHLTIIESVHNALSGHFGIKPTMNKLLSHGHHWPGMRLDVVNYIQCCAICQKMRVTQHDAAAHGTTHAIESWTPFEECSVDTLEVPEDSDGFKYILVCICSHTRYVELAASADKSASSWSTFLLRVFCRFGAPRYLRSDQGGEFVNNIIVQMTQMFQCTQRLTIGYRPQANGICERVNGEILRHLRVLVSCSRIQSCWSLAIPIVMRILNAHDSNSTGYAPATIVYGGVCDLDRGIMASYVPAQGSTISSHMSKVYSFQANAIMASQRHLASVIDKRVSKRVPPEKEISAGNYVLLSNPDVVQPDKLASPWRGPYLVKSHVHNNYTLQDLRTLKELVVDVSRLKLFHVAEGVDPTTVAALDENEDIVDSILEHRTEKPRTKSAYFFKVKFIDTTEVWLPYMEIRNNEALDRYVATQPSLNKLFGTA